MSRWNPEVFADRYRRVTDYVGGADDPEDRDAVLAMQMVLHIEKTDPPDRRSLLIAAARAAVLVCLDERADPDGPWAPALDAWCDARIRKIARRARGKHWADVQDLDGITVEVDGVQARAFVPSAVGAVDHRIKRLQIGGTDVAGALPADAPAGEHDGLCLWLDPSLEMSVGKTAAQVGHAAMLGVALLEVSEAQQWFAAGCPLDVREAEGAHWGRLVAAARRGMAAAVHDAGFTEIAPGSTTVIADRARI